jgi:hypothetical protein
VALLLPHPDDAAGRAVSCCRQSVSQMGNQKSATRNPKWALGTPRSAIILGLLAASLLFMSPLLLLPYSTAAPAGTWRPIGLRAETVLALAVASNEGERIIYAETHTGLQRLLSGRANQGDGGWKRIDESLPSGPLGRSALAAWRLVPGRPRQLYALTGSGTARQLYRSDDGGDNWQLIGPAPGQTERPPMVVLPGLNGAHDTIALITGSRVQRSTDNGATWAPGGLWPNGTFGSADTSADPEAARPFPRETQDIPVKLLLGDGNAPNRLYALTAAGALWLSDSGGLTWQVGQPISEAAQPVTALAIVPYFGVRVWAASTGSLSYSTDNGDHWTQSALPPMPYGRGHPAERVTALLGDPRVPDTVYVALAWGATHRSDDSGTSWTPLGAPGSSSEETGGAIRVNALVLDPDSRAALYAATDDGVWVRDVVPLQPTAVPMSANGGSPSEEDTPTPAATQRPTKTPTPSPAATSTQTPSPIAPPSTETLTPSPTVSPRARPTRTPRPPSPTLPPEATATADLRPTLTSVPPQPAASDSKDLPPPPPATDAPSIPTPRPR